jgi:hypothetical protein
MQAAMVDSKGPVEATTFPGWGHPSKLRAPLAWLSVNGVMTTAIDKQFHKKQRKSI